ncbi:hypothetical protein M409DRAFT_20664 [Zasmidium cellare ATCC 36951]|uniref:Heterokaryon incompatibility domain-containing protein n=1 Tax=Zasmidium cellare ATCC 36951 TaxID=1080233 RepID=A0A6A6CQS8_ZASCE|nr:uncharacterized protein M409DRAFT_20664 [Zasmidium cellare ATCC 36951]KAF2169445.1 hypothetical protein M409DRAFT_20664 [Zasmidium cellare ATCC 36951]
MVLGLSYRPLDPATYEIRLLRVHAGVKGSGRDVIRCDLFHASLQDPGLRYDALSYCWGDESRTAVVNINGQDLTVRLSLESGLRHLRYPDRELIIWVDAICINQADTSEKNHQIQQMDSIYSQSQAVRAWLGPTHHDRQFPLVCLKRWAATFTVPGEFGRGSIPFPIKREDIAVSAADEAAVRRFAQRDYWTRFWILQELALAHSAIIHYGQQEILLDDLFAVRTCLIGLSAPFITESDTQAHLKLPDVQDVNEPDPLLNVLRSLKEIQSILRGEGYVTVDMATFLTSRGSKDPRDRIFGLSCRAATRLTPYQFVTPDYNKTLERVYLEYALCTIQNGDTYGLLRHSGFRLLPETAMGDKDLPSWAIDWRCPVKDTVYRSMRGVAAHNEATRVTATSFTCSRLWVQGTKIDEVCKELPLQFLFAGDNDKHAIGRSRGLFFKDFVLAPRTSQGQSPLLLLYRFIAFAELDCLSRIERDIVYHRDDRMLLELFFATLIKRLLVLELTAPETCSLALQIGSALLPPDARFLEVAELMSHAADIEERARVLMLDIMRFITSDVRFFLTENGRMGVGATRLREGDGIFALAPSGATFALRQEQSPEGPEPWFRNAGECFILDSDTSGTAKEEPDYMDLEIR